MFLLCVLALRLFLHNSVDDADVLGLKYSEPIRLYLLYLKQISALVADIPLTDGVPLDIFE